MSKCTASPLPDVATGGSRTPRADARGARSGGAGDSEPTKHLVEGPTRRGVTPIGIGAETEQIVALHDRVHEAFVGRESGVNVGAFVDWIYRELFAMPPDDPVLGLDMAGPFSAVV